MTTRPRESALPQPQDHAFRTTNHHRPGGGFRNIWDSAPRPRAGQVLSWLASRALRDRSRFEPTPFEPISPDELRAPVRHLHAYWLGQATVLLRTPALTVITDPVFAARVSPVSFAGPERQVGVPIGLVELPEIDVVVLSHNHYDHLDADAVATLARRHDPLFVVPLGVGQNLTESGIRRFVELDWWQYVEFEGCRFSCTPAKHFSGRGAFDRDATLWASWLLEFAETSVYFGGDSGYGPFYEEIRERLGAPDLALLPIGAYLPRWFMRAVHVDPAEAVRAFLDLGAERFLPIHWGTYDLADELLHEPPLRLMEAAERAGIADDRIAVLAVGGSLRD